MSNKKIWEDDKPDPVQLIEISCAIIHLGMQSPASSSNSSWALRRTVLPKFGLASDRVYHRLSFLKSGQAPKAGISPCLPNFKLDSGIFSVILSVALRPPVFHWYPLL